MLRRMFPDTISVLKTRKFKLKETKKWIQNPLPGGALEPKLEALTFIGDFVQNWTDVSVVFLRVALVAYDLVHNKPSIDFSPT